MNTYLRERVARAISSARGAKTWQLHADEADAVLAELGLATADAAPQPQPVCKCSLRTRLVGDGCAACNPALAAELADEAAPQPQDEPVACRHESWEATPHQDGRESRKCADCREYLGVFEAEDAPPSLRDEGSREATPQAEPKADPVEGEPVVCICGEVDGHTTQCLYEHFLAYSGLEHDPMLRYAYFHGANVSIDRPTAPQPQAEPVGKWVLVPREPTRAMLSAGRARAREGYTLEAAWAAMLAAAPERGGE